MGPPFTDYAASVPVATGSALGVCDAAKIKCVGKYVTAVLKCDSKAAGKTGTIDTKCTGKAVDKLANGAGGCLDKAAQHAGCTNAGNQAVVLEGAADQFVQDTVVALASDPRFVDNGDGTVSDSADRAHVGEKTTAVGSGPNFADPHDVDNTYTWTASGSPYPPDGTVFTDFSSSSTPCRALRATVTGGCPRRKAKIPRSPEPKELEGLLMPPVWGKPVRSILSSRRSPSSIGRPLPTRAVRSSRGASQWHLYSGFKTGNFYVRAVRTGP